MKNGRLHGGGRARVAIKTPKNARKLKGFFSGESNDTSQTTSYYKTTRNNEL